MPDPILALTLHPEWAWAITHLGKRCENRSPRFAAQIARRVGDGWLAIHAGVKRPADFHAVGDEVWRLGGIATFVPKGQTMAGGLIANADGWLFHGAVPTHYVTEDTLTRGAIVALVKIGDVLPPGITADWKVDDSAALTLSRVLVLPEPIPCKGAQGLWTPAPDVQERLRAALEADRG